MSSAEKTQAAPEDQPSVLVEESATVAKSPPPKESEAPTNVENVETPQSLQLLDTLEKVGRLEGKTVTRQEKYKQPETKGKAARKEVWRTVTYTIQKDGKGWYLENRHNKNRVEISRDTKLNITGSFDMNETPDETKAVSLRINGIDYRAKVTGKKDVRGRIQVVIVEGPKGNTQFVGRERYIEPTQLKVLKSYRIQEKTVGKGDYALVGRGKDGRYGMKYNAPDLKGGTNATKKPQEADTNISLSEKDVASAPQKLTDTGTGLESGEAEGEETGGPASETKVLDIKDQEKQVEAPAELIDQKVERRMEQRKTDLPLTPATTLAALGETAATEAPKGRFGKAMGWLKNKATAIGKFFRKNPEAAVAMGVGLGAVAFTPALLAAGLAAGAYGVFRYIRKINREGGGTTTEEEPVAPVIKTVATTATPSKAKQPATGAPAKPAAAVPVKPAAPDKSSGHGSGHGYDQPRPQRDDGKNTQ